MESRKPYLATLPGLILGCLVCCALWGSAFPCIKIGYALFGIPAHDSASQLLFAGLRFTLAGALVIVGMSAAQRRPLIPQARDIKPIFVLSLFQTIGQYFFFYLGLSRASAMSSSIIEASANFLAILFAALAFHTEKLNTAKVLGCALGFAGVALVNLSGADGTFGFRLDGEGFILASTVSGALSTCLIGIFSRKHDGVLLAGWQFLVGGLVLTAIGFLMGGALSPTAIVPAIVLIIYMALISAVAYSQPRLGLWVYEPGLWRTAERTAAWRGRRHEPRYRHRCPALGLQRHHHRQQTQKSLANCPYLAERFTYFSLMEYIGELKATTHASVRPFF